MKKYHSLSLLGIFLFLSACNLGSYQHTTEPRSTTYIGQPYADLYENFGAPTKIKKINDNEYVFVYFRQDIEKDWSYKYLHECEMKFYMVDGRVSDWTTKGDICVINSLSGEKFATGGYQNGLSVSSANGLPSDAFRDSFSNQLTNFADDENKGEFFADEMFFVDESIDTEKDIGSVENSRMTAPVLHNGYSYRGEIIPDDAF